MRRILIVLASVFFSCSALALSLSDLSQADVGGGLKDALAQGAEQAVALLGKPGGFSNNPQVRIGLPDKLEQAAKMMKRLGMGAQVTQLEASMNQAAEAAVPQAKELLVDAVKKMTLQDAKAILSGGQDSATRYLERTSRVGLRTRFLPIVKQATDRVGLAQQYNTFAGQAAKFGAIDAKSANIEGYVTEQALNGLFKIIADQERSIRSNPAAAATGLAKKVFGLVK